MTDKPIPARRNVSAPGATTRPVRPGLDRTITADDAKVDPAPLFDTPPPANLGISEVDSPAFTRGPARRPMPRVTDPLLQWSTGLQTKERTIYAGWLLEAGKHAELDDAMARAGFSPIVIKHGSGNMVTHWAIETANLFVVAEGVQSIGEMKGTSERYGIAFGWRRLDDGRQQSVLRFRAFLHELLDVGFTEPLLVTAKSTLTGDLIAALTRQYDVLDAVDAFRAQDQKPALQPPFYACSIPLGPGQEVARGSGSQTREIAPIIAQIPNPITKEYIRSHWTRREWAARIESMLDQTIAWSKAASKLIGAGEERSEEGRAEELPAEEERPLPPGVRRRPRFARPEEES